MTHVITLKLLIFVSFRNISAPVYKQHIAKNLMRLQNISDDIKKPHKTPARLTRSSAVAEESEASCQLKSCQLLRNSAETTCTTSVRPSAAAVCARGGNAGGCREFMLV